MQNTALIIIDIQNDYFPGGAIPLDNPDAALSNALSLLKVFRDLGLPVFHIQHETPAGVNPQILVKGTRGQEIHPHILPGEGEPHMLKHFPSSFTQTNLHEQLRAHGITKLVLVGMMTQMCVSSTSRAAMELGYQVIVAGDATAAPNLKLGKSLVPAAEVKRANLAALDGMVAQVMSAEECVARLTVR